MTKQIAIIISGLLMSASVFAMPSTLSMKCADVAELVRTRGAVLLSTAPGVFDRYVLSDRFCEPGMVTAVAWIQTVDSAQCFVGATCTVASPAGGN